MNTQPGSIVESTGGLGDNSIIVRDAQRRHTDEDE